MAETTIAWCDYSFNPWEGCAKVSAGCTHCYAEARAQRFGTVEWGAGKPRRRTSPANWRKPLAWDREASSRASDAYAMNLRPDRPRVFCSSLADVFDNEVPVSWLSDLAALIEQTPHLDWLLLTKRPENYWRWKAATFNPGAASPTTWPLNVWLGVTVENQREAERRIPLLLAQDAVVRFLSCEPLLGPLDLTRWLCEHETAGSGIHWCIIGGESGHHARPFDLAWARSLVRQCRSAGVAPFVKQLGARPVQSQDSALVAAGIYPDDCGPRGRRAEPLVLRDRAGADPAEWPEDLRVREWPEVRR